MKQSFLSFCLLFVLIFSGCSQTTIPERIPRVMPEFTFYNMKDNQAITRMALTPQGNVVFIFFDPGCSHCQKEAQEMGKQADAFKDVSLYFISQQEPQLVRDFMNTYAKDLVAKVNPQVLIDSDYTFLPLFNPSQYPALYVYSQKRKLLAYLEGENPIERVIEAVHTKP